MAYTSQYDYDIYVSYADVDNQPYLLRTEGWIDTLCHALASELSKRIGESGVLKIWRTSRASLSESDSQVALNNSAVFIAAVSDAYLSSGFSLKELQTFHDAVQGETLKHFGLIGQPSRIFHLLLKEFTFSTALKAIDQFGAVSFPFYEKPRLTFSSAGTPSDPDGDVFREQLNHLVDNVYKTLQSLGGGSLIPGFAPTPKLGFQPSIKPTLSPKKAALDETKQPGPAAKQSCGIFISYRRGVTTPYAELLYDQLANKFGENNVFRDINTVEPGEDFVDTIKRKLASCSVLVALIHEEWLEVKDKKGRRRLDDPDDYVVLEISIALQRNIRVIPLLLQGASMPRSDDLPAVLANLSRRSAFEARDTHWKSDVNDLIKVLEKHLH